MSSTLSDSPAALSSRTAPHIPAVRNPALDFTKGALVLCMIAYHTINYFRYDPNLLRHLHFLPPSFIFLAGFLVTHVYLPKIRSGDTRVPARLFLRGVKTVALFLVLNFIVQSIFSSSYNRNLGLDSFIDRLDVVFITGEQRAAVFGILLPIGYVLVLAAILLLAFSIAPYALPLIAGFTLAACIFLANQGRLVANLDLVSMGLLGTAFGFISRSTLDRAARVLPFLLVAYVGYSVAVRFQYPTYAMNLVGVTISVLLLYSVGLRLRSTGFVAEAFRLLGNYSLLSYLVQIAFLQFLFRTTRHLGVLMGDVLLPLFLTTLATFGLVKLVDALRSRTTALDRTYKAVFA